MNTVTSMYRRGQRGVVLVVSLVLLIVITVLGIAAMSSVNMQERMAGNTALQARAFETASAGVADSMSFVQAHMPGAWNCGSIIDDESYQNWSNVETEWLDDSGNVAPGTPADGDVLWRKLYCLAHADVPRTQIFVLNRGQVFSGGTSVALRDIEVRVDIQRPRGVEECKAICLPGGTPGNIDMPQSGAYTVDGGITAGNEDLLGAIVDGVAERPNGNYLPTEEPFVLNEELPLPWGDPAAVWEFAETLKGVAAVASESGCATCYYDGSYSNNGNLALGTEAQPQVTYVDGDLTLGGGPSGHGILVVNGNLSWSGTAQFYGLVIVLGDSYTVTGGGNGGVEGSIVLAPVKASEGAEYGSINMGFHSPGPGRGAGGGNQLYLHDCDQLEMAAGLVSGASLEFDGQNHALGEWVVGDTCGGQGGAWDDQTRLFIASWRENIGWRELGVVEETE